jgi:hypothetical protein
MAEIEDVRRIALGLPETSVSDHFGAPSFRVNKKIFAILRQPGRVTLKLDPEDQHNLTEGRPGVVEPVAGKGARDSSAGRAGWTYVRYGLCDEDEIARLLRLAWSGVAPRRLAGR